MKKLISAVLSLVMLGVILAFGAVIFAFTYYGRDLPDHAQLASYEPAMVTRVHAGDGRLLTEFATQKRVFVPADAIPAIVRNAFIAAEDQRFYTHPGIDVIGLGRAMVFQNLPRLLEGKRLIGASTITQQVAKNFLTGDDYSAQRKIREAILAFRIEKALGKDRILELYLNEINLGFGSWGVAAAAQNYFDKSLDELTIAEAAYLAAVPKAPAHYHPIRQKAAAITRRNWVIDRMAEDGYITAGQAAAAKAEDLVVRTRADDSVTAYYFAEEVRREIAAIYGYDALYKGGLSVRTTVDPRLQDVAGRALRAGLIEYDRRHGWRGPVAKLPTMDDWPAQLGKLAVPPGGELWRLAVVLDASGDAATIGFADRSRGTIPMGQLRWAREWRQGERLGPEVKRPSDVLEVGEVVLVEPVAADPEGKPYPEGTYALRQIPAVQGALVALDPHTGRVLAVSGGFSYTTSEFNRATQARRQTGSAFKPFVYLAALDNGYTPASVLEDAPISIEQGPGLPLWEPENYTEDHLGPITLRVGLEKSRNLITVRLAQAVGMDRIVDVAERFGIYDKMPPLLSYSLGAGETTPLRLTAAYAMLVNGGKKIVPTFVDRIQDRHGRTIFRHDDRPCEGCRVAAWDPSLPVPDVPDNREQIADPRTSYQIVAMLEGVVQRGTATSLQELGRPVAGKTGTTNDNFDAWFVGFTPDLAVGVFVGFDQPRSLGSKETGGSVAAPIFKRFMAEALAEEPAIPFRVPPGLVQVRINAETGLPAQPGDQKVIWEPFLPGTEPRGTLPGGLLVQDGKGGSAAPASALGQGTGGLY